MVKFSDIKFYHFLEGYSIMENFFLMPAASIVGQLIEDTDKKSVCNVVLILKCR